MKIIKIFRVILWDNDTISGYDENNIRAPESINKAFSEYFGNNNNITSQSAKPGQASYPVS